MKKKKIFVTAIAIGFVVGVSFLGFILEVLGVVGKRTS